MRGLTFVGRPPIEIAETVQDVVSFRNTYAATIMDRSAVIDEDFVDAVVGQSIFGWERRNPQPALTEDGRFRGTDLDLLSFLMPVAERGAVIEIPHYRSRRAARQREDERHVGGGSRFGQLTGLTSNQDAFSFSARIYDQTVVVRDSASGREKPGAFRNFMLVDVTGQWRDGWDHIIWDPSAAENAFLNEHRLWIGNAISFRFAVHPNRWQSLFGAPYLLSKMLIERLRDEASFYYGETKRLKDAGIRFPPGTKGRRAAAKALLSAPANATKKIKVPTLEVVLDTPDFWGSYKPVSDTPSGLLQAYQRRKLLLYTLKSKAQFIARADELAYFNYSEARIASWMPGCNWMSGYRTSRGRALWERMMLSKNVALRYRTKYVTQEVAD